MARGPRHPRTALVLTSAICNAVFARRLTSSALALRTQMPAAGRGRRRPGSDQLHRRKRLPQTLHASDHDSPDPPGLHIIALRAITAFSSPRAPLFPFAHGSSYTRPSPMARAAARRRRAHRGCEQSPPIRDGGGSRREGVSRGPAAPPPLLAHRRRLPGERGWLRSSPCRSRRAGLGRGPSTSGT